MATRITVGVSDYVYKRLCLLAQIHGRTKAVVAGELISDKVLELDAAIDLALENASKQNGIPVDELRSEWIKAEDSRKSEE